MPARGTLPTRSGGLGRILRPVLAVLVLLLVAAASAGATWFITQRMQPPPNGANVSLAVGQNPGQVGAPGTPGAPGAPGQTPQPTTFVAPPTTPVAVPAPIFVPIEAFTVTLQNADTERIMHVGLTLRVNDEQTRTRLESTCPRSAAASSWCCRRSRRPPCRPRKARPTWPTRSSRPSTVRLAAA